MQIANQILQESSPLIKLLGNYKENHVGYVYSMSFTDVSVLTNDAWKEQVAGIPHNSFLVAAAFDPNKMSETHTFDKEIVLLRVLGPSPLPSDADLIKTRIEHNQRRIEEEVFVTDVLDGLDPLTHAELQYGALKCRILGTFYEDNGELRLGSDLENYMSSTRLRVFKPRGDALNLIINHINPEVKNKSLEEARKSGFSGLPTPIEIGTVRYTSTARLHRGRDESLVPVMIQPSDFLARRTAVLGMTRTGKSNTVKTTVAAVALSAIKDNIKVGQIIFDINGEYANANHQDDGSSIADVFGNRCIRYRSLETLGFEDLRTNFYEEPDQGLNLIQSLFQQDKSPFSGQDLDNFMSSSLEEPDPADRSEHTRWKNRRSVFQCILKKAGYVIPNNYKIYVPRAKNLVTQLEKFAESQDPQIEITIPSADTIDITEASNWFETLRMLNLRIKEDQKNKGKPQIGIESSTKGNPWIDPTMESYLNMLVRENSRGNPFGGYRAIGKYTPYHTNRRKTDVTTEIIGHLDDGKIVILDLSSGPVEVRTVLSERIARQIFEKSFSAMNEGRIPQNVVIYVEEAHNLVGKKEPLTSTWPRIAKEGAKAKIAFIYATQEPSSIHPNILANTENWFVTHLNNEDELRSLGKFYDFADFHDSLKNAQDVGFARIKTLSSPFVVPTQINRFTPTELKNKLALTSGSVN